jgi:hypothetical protein
MIGLCLASSLWVAGGLRAQNVETIELKDGSVLEGYISEQVPGKSIVFMANQSTVVQPASAVYSISYEKKSIDSLPAEWKKWVEEHPQKNNFLELGNISLREAEAPVEVLSLPTELADSLAEYSDTTIVVEQPHVKSSVIHYSTPHWVKILEKGATIKYLDLSSQVYRLAWGDVKVLHRKPRKELALNGIVDVVKLKDANQEFSGEIVGQVLGKQMRLLKDDGIVEVIDVNKIASIRKEPLDKTQKLTSQSPLLDVVYTKSGESVTGVIAVQEFTSSKDNPSYLIVKNKYDDTRRIIHADVERYGRIVNPDFVAYEDVILNDTTILLNRKPVKLTRFVQENKEFVYAADTAAVVHLRQSDLQSIVLELKQSSSSGDFMYVDAMERVNAKKNTSHIGFTYENYAMYSARPVRESVSVNKTQLLEFKANHSQYFVLFLPKQKQGVLCKVE